MLLVCRKFFGRLKILQGYSSEHQLNLNALLAFSSHRVLQSDRDDTTLNLVDWRDTSNRNYPVARKPSHVFMAKHFRTVDEVVNMSYRLLVPIADMRKNSFAFSTNKESSLKFLTRCYVERRWCLLGLHVDVVMSWLLTANDHPTDHQVPARDASTCIIISNSNTRDRDASCGFKKRKHVSI